MNKILTGLAIVIAVVSCGTAKHAQRSPGAATLDKDLARMAKKAYSYRSDIDPEILKATKQWNTRYGILHSDWIENLDGKSITIKGDVLFPDLDYVSLKRYRNDLYVFSTPAGEKGMIKSDGTRLIPPIFKDIDVSYLEKGVVFAAFSSGEGRNGYVYNTDGIELCRFYAVKSWSCIYSEYRNTYQITAVSTTGTKNVCYVYPDGAPVSDERVFDLAWDSDKVTFTADSIIHTYFGKDKVHPYYRGYHKNLPRFSSLAYNFDINQMNNNVWYKKSREYLDKKEILLSAYCIDFFNYFEKGSLKSSLSMPSFLGFYFAADLRRMAGQYKQSINIYSGKDPYHPYPKGLALNSQNNSLYLNNPSLYTTKQMLKRITDVVNNMNTSYSKSIKAYAEQQQRQAEVAAAVAVTLGAAAVGTAAAIAGSSSSGYSSGSSYSAPAAQGGYSSGSSSSGSSSSGGSNKVELQEKHEKCSVCDGTGVCKICKGTGKRVYGGKEQRCAACDGHPKCKACDGRGYKIRY